MHVFSFIEVKNLVTNCARNLAKSTTKYHVTGNGLNNYIMHGFNQAPFGRRNSSKLIEVLQTKCHKITQD